MQVRAHADGAGPRRWCTWQRSLQARRPKNYSFSLERRVGSLPLPPRVTLPGLDLGDGNVYMGSMDGPARQIKMTMEPALIHPAFQYRTEMGSNAATASGKVALTPFDLASAVSFAHDFLTKEEGSYYLNFEAVPFVQKDAKVFPDYLPLQGRSSIKLADVFLRDVVWSGAFSDRFTSRTVYAN